MTSIDVRELRKTYGSVRAVDGVTCTVEPGRVTGFLGPNGAGKSSTMRIALGLDRPTAGRVTIGGRPYRAATRPLRLVGALLDAGAASGARTAQDHLRCLAYSNDLPLGRVAAVLAETGLETVARRRVGTFSLGMRQRLGVAAALLGDPPVLMLDEPTNGLDPEGIIWIRDLMRQLAAEGRTVLVSSHLMSETARTADHLIVLGRGRLLADTSMAAFIAEHSSSRVWLRTTEPERLRDLLTAAGLAGSPNGDGRWQVDGASAAQIGALAAAQGLPLLELTDDQASLEEAYLKLTASATEYASAPAAAKGT
ncbi:ABC transporter ATP-binding protein [Streptomyces zagrosensis]|uniref:ABC-2 type transport system ATP-binding protein n=1 Tax=Streptomyces zagrosensis TaxID=1042984 RepID=A0A7W9UZU2_9ACTN|nr:ATP-binding cassette domain-containing protein [Streptomyces zagrosensis]MBB5937127.1 ABC-2 type transport system ATP-binding protein [Streptomyces zagrosensis]